VAARFYVDGAGAWLGGYDGAPPPEGAIEVPAAPEDARATWDGAAWQAPAPTLAELVAAKLGAGLAVASVGTPGITARYSLDPKTLDEVGAVARDAAAGLGLPEEAEAFAYPDYDGIPRTFSAAAVQACYKALRDYISRCRRAESAEALAAIVDEAGIP
jgi:hypothetical protein